MVEDGFSWRETITADGSAAESIGRFVVVA